MKRVNLAEDVRPVSEFRANTAECIERVAKSKRPLVLTQHGRSAVVVLDVTAYQDLLDRLELLEDLSASEVDLREGRTRTQAQAKRDILGLLTRP